MQFFSIDDNNIEAFKDYIAQSKQAASSKDAELFHLSVYEGDEPVGAVSVEVKDTLARVINIFVREDYRRMGYGKGLISSVCIFLYEEGYETLTVSFVRLVGEKNPESYDDTLYHFFDSCDFFLGVEKQVEKDGVTAYLMRGVRA